MPKSILIIVIILLLSSGIFAADVTILFKDSTNIEDAYCYSLSPLTNYGRVGTEAIVAIGRNYSNYYYPFFRISSFKDSCDNHPGLIIDSALLIMFIHTATYDVNDESWVAPVGIDTNMAWVEGNRNAVAAQDCELCYDSARTIGAGTCADPLAWNTAGALGAGDTMGVYKGETEDSTWGGGNMIFDVEAAGDSMYFYLDTTMMNFWKDYAYANEGFKLHHWGGPNDQYWLYLYGSEANGGALGDSIPYVKLFGHTVEASQQTGRRRKLLQ